MPWIADGEDGNRGNVKFPLSAGDTFYRRNGLRISGRIRWPYLRRLPCRPDRLFGYCATIAVDPINMTRGDVAGYLHHLRSLGRRPATVARRLVVLRGFYDLAVAEYGLAASPVTGIRYRRVRNQTRIRALTGQQLAAFLQAADQALPRATGLAWLIATTGIRVSEACAARTEDLSSGDRPGEWWLDVACKGALRRTVPVQAATWRRLQPLVAAGAGPIFTTGEGRELDRHTAARDLARVATSAEIPGRFSPHLLRHTFVTLARQTGCPLEDVQDAVGHADPALSAAMIGHP